MKKSLLSSVVDQWSRIPAVAHADLSEKTVVVIGANTGIGFEAATHVARMRPAKLVLACRSLDKGATAAHEIESKTGFKSCEPWTVDLADFASVTRFAERFQRECDRLDILVMNAGMAPLAYEGTVDGWETALQVNHLGTALLSLLLLPRLVETGKKFGSTSRLVIVASDVHYWAVFPDDVKGSSNPVTKLNGPGYRDPSSLRGRYVQTKLLNVLFARALQDRLQNITPLTVNAVNPGFCYSRLRRNFRGIFMSISNFIMETCLAWTSEQGSRQLIYAAIGEQANEDHMKGAYISLAAVVEPSDFVISEEGRIMQDNLWGETMEILMQASPQLNSTVQEYLV